MLELQLPVKNIKDHLKLKLVLMMLLLPQLHHVKRRIVLKTLLQLVMLNVILTESIVSTKDKQEDVKPKDSVPK